MASDSAKSSKAMRRLESKKSHSWWWDSHISPKNSRWLQENLEKMDQNIKRMLKLVEEDGDSFAKKAEMYYQKRPELINLVEEFYRMYRSLAERYDNVTGELRKSIPSDLQSQGSGISGVGSEPSSTWPSPDLRPTRQRSGPRAAGFEFFLGGGHSSDFNKEGDESSTLDSESESDDSSSINNYSTTLSNDDDHGLRRKIFELESELREVKEKLHLQQQEISEGSFTGSQNGNPETLLARVPGFEEELRIANERLQLSEEEIVRLRIELQKYESGLYTPTDGNSLVVEAKELPELHEIADPEAEVLDPEFKKIQALEEDLRITKEKLHNSEEEVKSLRRELKSNESSIKQLQDQLGSKQKDASAWTTKLDKEKREVSRLQDRILRYKNNLSERDQEIRGLKETISNANKALSEENSQLQEEITKLLKERAYLQDDVKEMDVRCQCLEEEARRVLAGKSEMEALLGSEIELLKISISESNDRLEELNRCIEELKSKNDFLTAEKDELNSRVVTLSAGLDSRDDRIHEMNKHMHQLHMEHVQLLAENEGARKLVEELRSTVKDLETDIKRQHELIEEGAEEKREAIRQLCFSLEHYRNGYHRLREVVMGNKRVPVMAS
ncbi:protein NETWORKED 4A-like [Ipomoea triloba]|uniref:protein NETWORKED 4A-like n=1 Tax=Ipomoea triloba TaxID=35885 RepID=UPI00125E26ED|nr:protein NETWORKED 4A-like [Ipomoea triloba]XP_031112504.1 protein NETWORKED 4A-like [Ipomoea triloba]XP_031112505.1 protein NETWORKED 4A-like [Ipomoea triloba]